MARACLYHDCGTATADWAPARLGPQPLASMRRSPRAVAWRSRPSTYVVCADDQASQPGLQQILAAVLAGTGMADRALPFLSRPALVAGLLARLAKTRAGSAW